jgi:DNA-3-methyladenine glycosylase I
MPKPDEWHHHQVEPPANDNDYFERMSRVILMSGLNWATLEKKWPGLREAFRGFDVDAVAALSENGIDALMQNPAVIRNRPKITAIIHNAREFQEVKDEFGSFKAYLDSLRAAGSETALTTGVAKRFAFMGKGTTVIFLFSVGESIPEATRGWQARHEQP